METKRWGDGKSRIDVSPYEYSGISGPQKTVSTIFFWFPLFVDFLSEVKLACWKAFEMKIVIYNITLISCQLHCTVRVTQLFLSEKDWAKFWTEATEKLARNFVKNDKEN